MSANGNDMEYQNLVAITRPILEDRVIDRLRLKQLIFGKLVEETIDDIEELGYIFNASVLRYNASFIKIRKIKKFVAEWKGPCISRMKSNTMNEEICTKIGNNWIDTHIWKVSGSLFAAHIRNARDYLLKAIEFIDGISSSEQRYIAETSYKIFVVKILEKKVTYNQTSKPLITHKELRESDDILEALGELDSSLNLAQDSERKKLTSTAFSTKIKKIAKELEKKYLDNIRQKKKEKKDIAGNIFRNATMNNVHIRIAPILTPPINTNCQQQHQQYGPIIDRDLNASQMRFAMNACPVCPVTPNQYQQHHQYYTNNNNNIDNILPQQTLFNGINNDIYGNNSISNASNSISVVAMDENRYRGGNYIGLAEHYNDPQSIPLQQTQQYHNNNSNNNDIASDNQFASEQSSNNMSFEAGPPSIYTTLSSPNMNPFYHISTEQSMEQCSTENDIDFYQPY